MHQIVPMRYALLHLHSETDDANAAGFCPPSQCLTRKSFEQVEGSVPTLQFAAGRYLKPKTCSLQLLAHFCYDLGLENTLSNPAVDQEPFQKSSARTTGGTSCRSEVNAK